MLKHEVDVLRSENRTKTDEIANLKKASNKLCSKTTELCPNTLVIYLRINIRRFVGSRKCWKSMNVEKGSASVNGILYSKKICIFRKKYRHLVNR